METLRSNRTEKMYTYLKGYLEAKKFENAQKALPYAREIHEGQFRKGGEPYIIHPLSVSMNAILMNLADDELLATALLHDVVEDSNSNLTDLSVTDEIKQNVFLLTYKKDITVPKNIVLERYFEGIKTKRDSSLVKLFDRSHNLSTMAGVFTTEKTIEQLNETIVYIYDLLRFVKKAYPTLQQQTMMLKRHIYSFVDTIAFTIPEEERKRVLERIA